jgi:hypothetical protein
MKLIDEANKIKKLETTGLDYQNRREKINKKVKKNSK